MEQWQERAVQELAELDERIERLGNFMASARFEDLEPIDQCHLHAQRVGMVAYRDALDCRVARFR